MIATAIHKGASAAAGEGRDQRQMGLMCGTYLSASFEPRMRIGAGLLLLRVEMRFRGAKGGIAMSAAAEH